MGHQISQTLIAISQLLNAALLGGFADETTSSRCWRMRVASPGWYGLFMLVDFIFGDGHCQSSYESERIRSQMPPDLRDK